MGWFDDESRAFRQAKREARRARKLRKIENKNSGLDQQIQDATEEQSEYFQEQLEIQQGVLDAQKQQYKDFEFTNPFAGTRNQFEGMENTFEDLTVSQEAARFQMEQGTQQRANIMAGLRGAAGSSGIAGLAQSLANQGTFQARQVSTDIAKQEAANARLSAQGAAQVQQLERQGAQTADVLRRQGAGALQQAEFGRESTLYAAELGELAGLRGAMMGAYGNQMAGFGAMAQMDAARTAGQYELLSSIVDTTGDYYAATQSTNSSGS
jgi:hypothetical protein